MSMCLLSRERLRSILRFRFRLSRPGDQGLGADFAIEPEAEGDRGLGADFAVAPEAGRGLASGLADRICRCAVALCGCAGLRLIVRGLMWIRKNEKPENKSWNGRNMTHDLICL